jgi:hypothetical protein
MFLNQTTIDAIKAGIANLESADVTPMGLAIYQNRWELFKYKALPSHPNPKNAGHGFSHPTNLNAFKTNKGDANININSISSIEEAHKLACEICNQFGFTDVEIGNITDTGEIVQIILLRGGAQDYLTNDIQNGNQDKVSAKEKGYLKTEETETDNFVKNTHGGPREGAGRPATGRKRIQLYGTPDEEIKLKEYLQQLRSSQK